MIRTRVAMAVLVPVVGLTGCLAACTSGRGYTALDTDSSTPPAAASTAPSTSDTAPTTPSGTPATSSPDAPTTPAPSSSASSASSKPADPTPAFTTTCTALSVRVLKGGAIRGAEIAAMQFVNDGAKACTITGTPTARLMRKGATIGTRSRPNGATASPFTLQPGDYGESLLRDFSTCDAPLSDNLRLRLPTRNGTPGRTITEPVQLRACTLQAAPVGQPS